MGCRNVRDKRELIRIVRTPAGEVEIDPTSKKAGRGAYLCPQVACLEAARKAGSLEKALETSISPEIWEKLHHDLEAGVPLNPLQLKAVREQKKKR